MVEVLLIVLFFWGDGRVELNKRIENVLLLSSFQLYALYLLLKVTHVLVFACTLA